jgi:hypothetical protein
MIEHAAAAMIDLIFILSSVLINCHLQLANIVKKYDNFALW